MVRAYGGMVLVSIRFMIMQITMIEIIHFANNVLILPHERVGMIRKWRGIAIGGSYHG